MEFNCKCYITCYYYYYEFSLYIVIRTLVTLTQCINAGIIHLNFAIFIYMRKFTPKGLFFSTLFIVYSMLSFLYKRDCQCKVPPLHTFSLFFKYIFSFSFFFCREGHREQTKKISGSWEFHWIEALLVCSKMSLRTPLHTWPISANI